MYQKNLNTMNAKSIFLGFLAGVVLTVAGLFAIRQTAAIDETSPNGADPIQYLSQPESYEGKEETSVKVFLVLDNAALANEISNKESGWYDGNTVMIIGKKFYCDQIITIKKPRIVGTCSHHTQSDTPMTIPVIESGE